MKLYGIIGKPLDHSLSPKFFNALFKKFRMECRYLPFQVERVHLKNLIACMKLVDVYGLNVTAPYKEAVIPFLDGLTEAAKKCGAVNTIVRRRHQFIGHNTDGSGFLKALQAKGKMSPAKKRIVIIGAGGAARGIAGALAAAGAQEIIFLSRHSRQAKKAARHLQKYFRKTSVKVSPLTTPAAKRLFPGTDVLIQATPAFVKLPLKFLPKHAIVCDVIYQPRRTPLLKQASRWRLKTLEGRWMFLYQARANWKLWMEKNGWKVTP